MGNKTDKYPAEYLFWRKRIEGQIRHTMNEHPEWFNLPNDEIKTRCIRSTAKRIIGEIVAGISTGNNQGGSGNSTAANPVKDAVQCVVPQFGAPDGIIAVGRTSILQKCEERLEEEKILSAKLYADRFVEGFSACLEMVKQKIKHYSITRKV